ncbi:MAG: nucleotidyltransferase family protein [Cyanobacteria bacterium J06560_6]
MSSKKLNIEETSSLSKQHVLSTIDANQDRFQEFAVKALFLFGSVARGEATPQSDIDLLVEFEHPVGLFALLRLQSYLEDLLGRPVDLGTPNSLRPHLRETVLQEAIRAL